MTATDEEYDQLERRAVHAENRVRHLEAKSLKYHEALDAEVLRGRDLEARLAELEEKNDVLDARVSLWDQVNNALIVWKARAEHAEARLAEASRLENCGEEPCGLARKPVREFGPDVCWWHQGKRLAEAERHHEAIHGGPSGCRGRFISSAGGREATDFDDIDAQEAEGRDSETQAARGEDPFPARMAELDVNDLIIAKAAANPGGEYYCADCGEPKEANEPNCGGGDQWYLDMKARHRRSAEKEERGT